MKLIHSIILGLIQGLTEFLPVSSSGHLVLFENLFGLESAENSNLFFDVLLHFGTLVAVVIAFRQDILELLRAFLGMFRRGDPNRERDIAPRRMILLLLVATLPLVAVLPFKDYLEGIRAYPWAVGIALVVTAVLLLLSDRFTRGKKTERSASILDALLVGAMQAVAVTPGISRSGSTITMGVFRGFARDFAVRFSFILSLPAVLGATILETADAIEAGIDWAQMPIYLVGMVVAGVSGFFAIKLVRWIAAKANFKWFALYCAIAGVTAIVVSIF